MSNGYLNYNKLDSLLEGSKQLKIKEKDYQKIRTNILNERIPLDKTGKYSIINKEPINNIKGKKKEEPSKNNKEKEEKADKYNDLINNILTQKETKLLTNSLYVSFENKIGQNSCYINVIMHFLYLFPCVNDFLIKKYKDQLKSKEKENVKNKLKEIDLEKPKEPLKEKDGEEPKKAKIILNKDKIKEDIDTKKPEDTLKLLTKAQIKQKQYDDFLFNLGKVLNTYQEALTSDDSKKNITNLDTSELRKSLSICSDNQFKLNNISDPVEFLIYILDLINKENNKEIHLYFHLKLSEDIRCNNFCPVKSNKKYDKDNFIYQIYVEEIFNYIKNQKLDFDDFNENLFMLSYYSLQNEVNTCEKCHSIKNKILICNNEDGCPKFLLVNCVWNNAKPDVQDVVKFLYFISLIEQLDNLFICPSKTEDTNYYLLGIIFYSFTLCHYINMIYNVQNKVFTLFNDNGIIEFKKINEVFNYITKEQLKKNNKAYFYPVLLVYCKENIYDEKNFTKSVINKINYESLINQCKLLAKEREEEKRPREKILTAEEKEKNIDELIKAQIKFNINSKYNLNNEYELQFLEENEINERKNKIINGQKLKNNNFLQSNNIKKDKSSSVSKNINMYSRLGYNHKLNTNNLRSGNFSQYRFLHNYNPYSLDYTPGFP